MLKHTRLRGDSLLIQSRWVSSFVSQVQPYVISPKATRHSQRRLPAISEFHTARDQKTAENIQKWLSLRSSNLCGVKRRGLLRLQLRTSFTSCASGTATEMSWTSAKAEVEWIARHSELQWQQFALSFYRQQHAIKRRTLCSPAKH